MAPANQSSPVEPAAGYQNDRYWTTRLERDFNLAGVGHAGVGEAFNAWAYRVRRAVLLRTLAQWRVPVQGARILEFGFGTGYYLDLWRQAGAGHVSGFDITDIAVANARTRYGSLNWQFARADIGQPLDLKDAAGTFDLATAFDVLFHLVDEAGWNGALDNLARGVKPGGHAVIFDKYQSVESAIGHVRRRTLEHYRTALEARGFEIVAVQPIFFMMNSPTDSHGVRKVLFKTLWSLAKLPYKLGRHVGLGEVLGGAMGAGLYFPELLLGRAFRSGPSTKLLLARKKESAR